MNRTSEHISVDVDGIFDSEIKPLIDKSPRQDIPIALFIVAQPGSGKTTIETDLVHSIFPDSQKGFIAHIDADRYRVFHPHYSRFAAENDRTAANRCHLIASQWVDMAIDYVASRHHHAIVSGTFKSGATARKKLKIFREANYRNVVAFLAVHESVSALDSISRYYRQRRTEGFGRYVPVELHNEAYGALPTIARALEQGDSDLVDQILVYKRADENPLYAGFPRANRSGLGGASNAIVIERLRHWENEEVQGFRERAAALSGLIDIEFGIQDFATAEAWLPNVGGCFPSCELHPEPAASRRGGG